MAHKSPHAPEHESPQIHIGPDHHCAPTHPVAEAVRNITQDQAEVINPLVCANLSETASNVAAVLDFVSGMDFQGLGERPRFGLYILLATMAQALRVADALDRQRNCKQEG